MGLFKNDPPPAPDYTPLINAQTTAATQANQIAQDNLDWAKKTYAQNYALEAPIAEQQAALQKQEAGYATTDRANYDQNFAPVVQQLATDAQTWDSAPREAQAAGAAEGTVAQQFDQARHAATQNLESFGVDPTSTRYAALDIDARTKQAAAAAAAGNQAIQTTKQQGIALRQNAAQLGLNLNGQQMSEAGVSNSSGTGAVNNSLNTTNSGSTTMGTPTSWAGLGQNDLSGAVSSTNTQYQNALDKTKAENAASSGIGSLIGTVAGVAAAPFTGGASLGLLGALGGGTSGLSSTGAITGTYGPTSVNGAPLHYAEGGAVPATMSPSNGAVTDDVPATINGAVPAKLNAGEFVIPRDVVLWEGQKNMHGIIAKARQGMAKATQSAVPTSRPPQQTQQLPMRAVG